MKLRFLGVGGAFCDSTQWQSNMAIESFGMPVTLIDCGSDIRHSLMEQYPNLNNYNFTEQLGFIYISHVHGDHVGGLEWAGFASYFNPESHTIHLLLPPDMENEIWENTLKGVMGTLEKQKDVNLYTYFLVTVSKDLMFKMNNGKEIRTAQMIKSLHMQSTDDKLNKFSYGLFISGKEHDPKTYITSDVKFENYEANKDLYYNSDQIFHDCETYESKSNVHPHYSDLLTLPDEIRAKMWLYHYWPGHKYDAVKDGFRGFVKKGDVFHI